jgi:molecular chaperone DnaJ
VAPDADTDQVRAAYRRLARQLHPDHNPHPAAGAAMAALNDAYRRMSATAAPATPTSRSGPHSPSHNATGTPAAAGDIRARAHHAYATAGTSQPRPRVVGNL